MGKNDCDGSGPHNTNGSTQDTTHQEGNQEVTIRRFYCTCGAFVRSAVVDRRNLN